ncbi:MAG: lipoate--protein ligase [Gordonibacter sp.]
MTKLTSHITASTDPFANLAREEALCDAVQDSEVVLYLWQNRNTIVIGRNQNLWKECRVEAFEAEGGRIARRLSGGGAVFHDLGNLNFTFVARDPLYDVARNCTAVCEAVRSLGLDAQVTGRNDLTVGGSKFSGNAFLNHGAAHCHHGTLMVNVDFSRLSHYLNPDPRKLAAKGVDSVRSRVVNLADLKPSITTEALAAALIAAAEREFGATAEPLDVARLDAERLIEREQFFNSREWRLGSTPPFTHRFDERFAWGDFDANLVVKGGAVSEARVFSDALDTEFVERIEGALPGCAYRRAALCAQVEAAASTPEQRAMAADCAACIARGMD